MAGKKLQLLREIAPKATRFAVLIWENSLTKALALEQFRAAAAPLGITLIVQEVGTTEALTSAFDVMRRERAQAVIVPTSPFVSNNYKRIIELAAQHRLSMFEWRAAMDMGGLISYGPSQLGMHRRAGYYVDRILKRAKPADLPVEQPMNFELFINSKTAKALGLTIPQSLLIMADKVIE